MHDVTYVHHGSESAVQYSAVQYYRYFLFNSSPCISMDPVPTTAAASAKWSGSGHFFRTFFWSVLPSVHSSMVLYVRTVLRRWLPPIGCAHQSSIQRQAGKARATLTSESEALEAATKSSTERKWTMQRIHAICPTLCSYINPHTVIQ